MITRHYAVAFALASLLVVADAGAQRRGGGGSRGGGGGMRGGGGGGMSRGAARSSVSRPMSRPSGGNFGGGRPISSPARSTAGIGSGGIRPGAGIGNQPGIDRGNAGRINQINGADRINNRPIDRGDINVDRGSIDIDNGFNGCCYGGWGAAAAGAVVGAAASNWYGWGAPVGTVVYTVPPECTTTVINGTTYTQCGSTYYEPQFTGTETSYVAVSPPSPSPAPDVPKGAGQPPRSSSGGR